MVPKTRIISPGTPHIVAEAPNMSRGIPHMVLETPCMAPEASLIMVSLIQKMAFDDVIGTPREPNFGFSYFYPNLEVLGLIWSMKMG